MRVLIVEDSKAMQSLLADLVTSVGDFEVVETASTELAATEWLENHPGQWQLATLDLLLSDGSGFNLIRRCRSQSRDGKIIVFSGFVTPAIAHKCTQMGADLVVPKADYKSLIEYCYALGGGQVAA